MAGMGGKQTLANWANRQDGLAAIGPMFERRREPACLGSAELHGHVLATGADHELKAVWTGCADLQTFERRL